MNRQITDRGSRFVKIARDDWDVFVAETLEATGIDYSDMPTMGASRKFVKVQLEAWTLLLCTIKHLLEAVEYEGARGGNGGGCCDEECEGHGGCDFGYRSIAVCNDGDVFICEA